MKLDEILISPKLSAKIKIKRDKSSIAYIKDLTPQWLLAIAVSNFNASFELTKIQIKSMKINTIDMQNGAALWRMFLMPHIAEIEERSGIQCNTGATVVMLEIKHFGRFFMSKKY